MGELLLPDVSKIVSIDKNEISDSYYGGRNHGQNYYDKLVKNKY